MSPIRIPILLMQLLRLALRINQVDVKRILPWDENMSPMQAKRCRKLGKSPTGPAIEQDLLLVGAAPNAEAPVAQVTEA